MFASYLLLAQAAPSGAGSPSFLIMMVALFAIMYFVMIRPQQKQLKEQKAMLAALKKGDEVITQGGMIGKVFQVADKVVTLEVSPATRIRVLKSSIQGKVSLSEDEVKAEERKPEERKESK